MQVEEFDRRLATIFTNAFAECYNVDEIFRLALIMGTISLRPTILELLYDIYDSFMSMLHEYFDDVKVNSTRYYKISFVATISS